jgi:hypothetical protein
MAALGLFAAREAVMKEGAVDIIASYSCVVTVNPAKTTFQCLVCTSRLALVKAGPHAALKLSTNTDIAKYAAVAKDFKKNALFYRGVQAVMEVTLSWSTRLQASKSPTASLVYYAFESMICELESLPLDGDRVIKFRDDVCASLKSRMSMLDFPEPDVPEALRVKRVDRAALLHAASMIDVRTAGKSIDDSKARMLSAEVAGTPQTLCAFIVGRLADWHMAWRANPVSGAAAGAADSDDILAVLASGESSNPRGPLMAAIARELVLLSAASKALCLPGKLPDIDPLAFYKDNLVTYPCLSQLACSILALQASSAESERGFSRAGIIDTALRNRLSAESLEAATIVRSAELGGISLLDVMEKMQLEKKAAANKKRSATQLENRAKRANLAAAATETAVGGAKESAAGGAVELGDGASAGNDGAAASTATPPAAAAAAVAAPSAAAVETIGDDDSDDDAAIGVFGGEAVEDIAPCDEQEVDENGGPIMLADFAEFAYSIRLTDAYIT